MKIFNETIYYNAGKMKDDLIYVSSCGILLPDPNYVIARENSKTTVFAYILSGGAYLTCNGRMERLKQGDCYLFPARTNNKIETDPLSPHSMLWLNCRGSLLDSLVEAYFDVSGPIVAMHSIETEFARISTLIQSPSGERTADEIALLIHKILLDMRSSQRKAVSSNSTAVSPMEDQIANFISNHIQEKFSINSLCEAFHLSDRQLSAIFKKKRGCTPYDYYLSKKIELATAMLRDSNLSIDAIAERLNFADRNHFTKQYIKKMGVSPARYRKSVQMTTD